MSELEEARFSLRSATHDAEIVSDGLIKSSEKISKLATVTLYGLLGGIVGLALGVLIPETQIFPQVVGVSLSALAGMTLGVLLYRSRYGGVQVEQKIAVNRMLSLEVMSRIKEAKDAGAPEYVISELWTEFRDVAIGLHVSSSVDNASNAVNTTAFVPKDRGLPPP